VLQQLEQMQKLLVVGEDVMLNMMCVEDTCLMDLTANDGQTPV